MKNCNYYNIVNQVEETLTQLKYQKQNILIHEEISAGITKYLFTINNNK